MRSISKKAFENLMSLGVHFLVFYGKYNIENYKKTHYCTAVYYFLLKSGCCLGVAWLAYSKHLL